jgi:hypothetical protein
VAAVAVVVVVVVAVAVAVAVAMAAVLQPRIRAMPRIVTQGEQLLPTALLMAMLTALPIPRRRAVRQAMVWSRARPIQPSVSGGSG